MVLVKSVEVDIGVKGDRESKAKLDDITKRAEELKKAFPEYKLKIDSAAAAERLKVFRAQLAEATKDRTANVKIKVDDSALLKLANKMKGAGGPAWLGPALLGLPAIATLGGVGAGAAIGLGGAAIAGGGALAGFAAVAKPVLAGALKAEQAVNAAQNNYNAAIAAGTKQSVAYRAEQKAIAKAYADMSPAQIKLSQQLGVMAQAWQNLKAAQTPVIAGALQPWLAGISTGLGNLKSVIAPMGPVIHDLGVSFGVLMGSSTFQGFMKWVGTTGAAVNRSVGGAVLDLLDGIMNLLPQFTPLITGAAAGILKWGDAFARWSASQKAADQIHAFLKWFKDNGPVVGDLLKNIGAALKTLTPGLTAGGITELRLISDFFAFVAKLPKGIAAPLAETAGALLLLNKLGVVSVGIKLLGLGGKGGAAAGAAEAGMWGKILPGVRLAGGALIAVVAVDMILKSTSSGTGKNWFDNPFGQGTFKDPKTGKKAGTPTALTSWTTLGHDIMHDWDMVWNNTIARTARGFHDVAHGFDIGRHDVSSIWDSLIRGARIAWDGMWSGLTGAAQHGWHNVAHWFDTGRHDIAHVFSIMSWNAIGWGQQVITGFWNGVRAVWHDVAGWFAGLPSAILHALGIHSPPDWAVSAGKHVMGGLLKGLAHGAADVRGFFRNIAMDVAGPFKGLWGGLASAGKDIWHFLTGGGGGSGVQRWAGTVLQALKMERLPASLLGDVLYQMQTESGGNPRAINLTDINAQLGDPSRGLMQVIGNTFRYWHWPGTSWDIYDPLANIAAALNYAAHGKGFGSGTGQIGSGHGYAAGTSSALPGWAWVGERGPELLRFRGGEQVRPAYASGHGGGNTYIINIAPAPLARPADIGREVVGAIRAFEKGAGPGWRK